MVARVEDCCPSQNLHVASTSSSCRDRPNAPRALRVNDRQNKADFCRPRISMRGARGISSFQLSVWKKPAAVSRRCGLSDRIESIPIESICNSSSSGMPILDETRGQRAPRCSMGIDTEELEQAVLALLYLNSLRKVRGNVRVSGCSRLHSVPIGSKHICCYTPPPWRKHSPRLRPRGARISPSGTACS